MIDTIRDRVAHCLATHRHLDLATVDAHGSPRTHPVGYWADGDVVYFATLADSRKALDIRTNGRVAYTVADDHEDWDRLCAVQVEGQAEILADPQEIDQVRTHMAVKFPRMQKMHDDPRLVIIRVRPTAAQLIDHENLLLKPQRIEY